NSYSRYLCPGQFSFIIFVTTESGLTEFTGIFREANSSDAIFRLPNSMLTCLLHIRMNFEEKW
ncbi:MAG TPA: hypothetical protein VFD46_10570, partial [Chryseolinea sp.]|nr:hypothetical protein [Chryseolinea sp.]